VRSKFIMFVIFLVVMATDVAAPDLKWLDSGPQPFQVFDDYVIAIGTEGQLEPVSASDVAKALADGKDIRLKYAKVSGDLHFHREIKQDMHFLYTKFSGKADLA